MLNKECVIAFDQNEHGTYFTGQIASGKVIITFNKPKKLKGIKLQISGYAVCQWRRKCGRTQQSTKEGKLKKNTYYGREDYIASTTYLVGSNEGKNFTVDAGVYTYTFACPIPVNCPSSFEGTFGSIRYLAKVTFLRSGCADRTKNVGFTVLKLLDLNQESRLLKTPTYNEAMETFCLFQTKAVHMKVDVMQSGYVPGQIMLVSVHINNESSFDCKKMLIILNLRATYTSHAPCMRNTSEKICLVKKICGPVHRQSKKDFAETIRIPATPPTSEHLSKVVRVSYELRVVASMNHFMRDPVTIIPITIGNVPLMSGSNPVPRIDDVPTTSSSAMRLAATGSEISLTEDLAMEADEEVEEEIDMPPPTYEQAMFMTTNIADDDANTVSEVVEFTPCYPVYDVENMLVAQATSQGPPPNKPQKRRRRRRKPEAAALAQEKQPVESPVQI